MITGIVQIADTWMARHLEPDLHVCDTLLYLATFLCVTSLMTCHTCDAGLSCDQLTPGGGADTR